MAASVHPRPSPSEVRDRAGQSGDAQPGAHIPHGFRWANRVSVAKQPPLFPERPEDPVKQQISDERESRAAEPTLWDVIYPVEALC